MCRALHAAGLLVTLTPQQWQTQHLWHLPVKAGTLVLIGSGLLSGRAFGVPPQASLAPGISSFLPQLPHWSASSLFPPACPLLGAAPAPLPTTMYLLSSSLNSKVGWQGNSVRSSIWPQISGSSSR